MKQLLIALAMAAGLVACGGGVDRDGTRDNIVNGLEDAGVEVDSECVERVLDGYSDDELENIDQTLEDGDESEQSIALLTALQTCVPATS
jgi:ribosomal protein L12E/L44/L45/RPP1/RPP2